MEPIIRTCPVCGKTYEANPVRLRHGRQTTCSRECSYKLRANKIANSTKMTCSTCGNEFFRPPSQVKSQHEGIYCSRKCHYAGRALGLTRRLVINPYVYVTECDRTASALKAWETRRNLGKDRHSEATKERLRQTTIRHVSRVAKVAHVSKLEDKVSQELTVIGVNYIRQYAVRSPVTGRYVGIVDF